MTENTKGLIVGIANEHSIAWGCAMALRAAGAELAFTYLDDKTKSFVEPLAVRAGVSIFLPLDVTKPEHETALFAAVREKWGRLDFLLHSIRSEEHTSELQSPCN